MAPNKAIPVSLITGVAYYAACVLASVVSQIHVDRYIKYNLHHASVNDEIESIHLPDIGFYHLPDYSHSNIVDDLLMPTYICMILLFTLVSANRFFLIKRFVAINGTAFFARSISIFITLMPKSNKQLPNDSVIHTTLEETLREAGMMITLNKKSVNDMMFSGHTSIVLTMMLCVMHAEIFNRLPKPEFIKSIIVSAAVTIFIGIITTRMHYTVDVYISCLITFLLYACYMLAVRNAHHLRDNREKQSAYDRFLNWYDN